jgi:hypothetical protein
MAKVGYGPKDFDPSDYQAAVRRLCSFLETLARRADYLEREADHQEHWPATSLRGAMWEYLLDEVPEVVEAAYMVAEVESEVDRPLFPVVPFVTKIVLPLDEMREASDAIVEGRSHHLHAPIPRWTEGEAGKVMCRAWRAILADYPEFRGALKLLELRWQDLPEAAPESERPAARRKLGRETKDLPRAVSDALLKRWNQRGENAPKREVWAAEAAKWLKDAHGAAAPDGELWTCEEVIRFLENAQERVRRKRR